MAYRVEWCEGALRDLAALDKAAARRIVDKLDKVPAKSPASLGKPLTGPYRGLLRYRIGDHSVIYTVEEKVLVILILKVGHWKAVYRK